jgi:hypothetical protein
MGMLGEQVIRNQGVNLGKTRVGEMESVATSDSAFRAYLISERLSKD